jgi:hypothetical protein
MKGREEFFINSEQKIESYLSFLALERHVVPATQNQAMNALVYLCVGVNDCKYRVIRPIVWKNIPVYQGVVSGM